MQKPQHFCCSFAFCHRSDRRYVYMIACRKQMSSEILGIFNRRLQVRERVLLGLWRACYFVYLFFCVVVKSISSSISGKIPKSCINFVLYINRIGWVVVFFFWDLIHAVQLFKLLSWNATIKWITVLKNYIVIQTLVLNIPHLHSQDTHKIGESLFLERHWTF